jgi:hypothetical protein
MAVNDEDRLEAVRTRRHDLHAVMVDLEEALAAPAVGRPDAWAKDVYNAHSELREALALHTQAVDGPGKMWEEILDKEPRLAHEIKWLRADHVELVRLVDEAMARTLLARDGDAVEAIRTQALGVLGACSRHRHRGANLVYEAYHVDISTGD